MGFCPSIWPSILCQRPSHVLRTGDPYFCLMTSDQLLFAYRHMIRARSFDHALINLYRQSKIVGGVYSQIGNEATSVGTAMALGDGDIIFPMHRDNGANFVR